MTKMNDVDLFAPIQTLLLPILPYGSLIEQTYSDFLLPAGEGIYKFGDLTPSIRNNKTYYTQIKSGDQVVSEPIVDFNNVENTVVDETGKIVIPAFMMRDKKRYLSNIPSVPARGVFIIKNLIEHHISTLSPWARRGQCMSNISKYFKRENQDIVEENYLERLCESLIVQINDFIGIDQWNMYFVKIKGLDLCIEKCMDYRIYEWTTKRNQEIEDGLHNT